MGGDSTGEQAWDFVTHPDGKVDLLIPGGSDKALADGVQAAAQLYPTWFVVDQGEYGLTGKFVTYAPGETDDV